MIDSTVVIAVADREAKKLIVSVARILFHLESTLPMRRSCQFVGGWKEKSRERERERIIYIYTKRHNHRATCSLNRSNTPRAPPSIVHP